MSGRERSTLFVLSCLHVVKYPPPLPKTGSQVYCATCRHGVTVAKVPSRYETRCSVSDCKRGNRDYGDAYVTAETKGSAHALRHAGHEVTVLEDGVVISTHKREPIMIDAPPF